MTNEDRYFLESNFVGVNRFFISVYSDQHVDSKRFRNRRYLLPKGIIENYNIIIDRKILFDQSIDSDTKRFEQN